MFAELPAVSKAPDYPRHLEFASRKPLLHKYGKVCKEITNETFIEVAIPEHKLYFFFVVSVLTHVCVEFFMHAVRIDG